MLLQRGAGHSEILTPQLIKREGNGCMNRVGVFRGWAAGGALLGMLAGAICGRAAFAETFTLACMPDPQYYTTSNHESVYDLYRKQAGWLVMNKAAYNIKHVVWLGDLTNDNTVAQWKIATKAYTILDNDGLSYAVCPGNHDYKTNYAGNTWVGANFRDLTNFNNYLGPQRFAGKSWYGGNMGNTTNHNENNYTFFSAAGMDFLVVSLEFSPTKDALTWANNLISQYPNHRVIIFTHAYLTSSGKYAKGGGGSTGTVGADGENISDELVKRHSNVFLVVCGHVGDAEKNYKQGNAGNPLTEILVDYQFEKARRVGDNLGNGWLRLLKFDTASHKIQAQTLTVVPDDSNVFENGIMEFYRGTYNSSITHSDHQFMFDYNMGPMQPYTYLNTSLSFYPRSVGQELKSDQQHVDIAQVDNGNWVAVWAQDTTQNGKYQVQVRGFDYDGNERFSKQVVNTGGVNVISATSPSLAMAPDGRFVVAWQTPTAIKIRTYNADGTPAMGAEQTVVAVMAPGTVSSPDVAIDDAGRFVVTWADDRDGNGLFDIRAQAFSFNGVPRFLEKTVNAPDAAQKINPGIAMAGNGNYVVVWQDNLDAHGDINMRGFTANDTELFAQKKASATVVGVQSAPAIGMDKTTGRFVVAWQDDSDLNGSYQVRALGYEANGTQRIAEFTVNQKATANQLNPSVSMDSVGQFYIAWEDNGQGGSGYQIMANSFDTNGTRLVSSDKMVNTVTTVENGFGASVRKTPVISGHKSGHYVVAWADDMDGNGAFQALATGMEGTGLRLATAGINGTVTTNPEQPFFRANDYVSVTGVPKPGYVFSKWTGNVPAGQSTANPLLLKMDSSKILKAEFVPGSGVGDWGLYE